ncbi:MAG: hypothetical protein ACK5S8_09645 [Pseudanabaena sp.]|jgi:hypothetical protein
MISFQIIATESEIEELKTRTHHKTYSVHVCKQSERIGYVSELTQTFDKSGTAIGTKQEIKSFYFGFANSAQAEKFEGYAKYKFPLLDKYHGHCEARLSKRLKSPFEVKIRNLATIKDELHSFFCQCIDKELAPKVLEMPQVDHDAMRAKVKRL